MYAGKKPTLSHLRVFGSIAYVHIHNEKRQKLDPRSEKSIFVGYSHEQMGHKSFNPSTCVFWVSPDVIFDRSASWYEPESAPSKPTEEELGVNSDDNIRQSPLPKDSPSSIELSAPHKQLSNQSTMQPSTKLEKCKGRMPEYQFDHPYESDSDMSACSLDNEFGVPIMQTPGIKKTLASTNKKL